MEKYLVVKQFEFEISNVQNTVCAKILKQVEPESSFPFVYKIDHHWPGSEYPSFTSGETIEEVELLLMRYVAELETSEYVERDARS